MSRSNAAGVAKRVALGALVAISLASAVTLAQRFDPRRGRTLIVGSPPGASPADRVDAERSGSSRTPLPIGTLRVEWRRSTGQGLAHAPLVASSGDIVLVGGRGEIVTLDKDGTEKQRTSVGVGATSAGAILSDGTIVILNSSGEAVGVRASGGERFRTRIGERGQIVKVAPLALEDGGVVVVIGSDIAALDAEGNVRARGTLPEAATWSPIAALGKVAILGPTGTVYTWSPGREPVRVGSFGGAVDGGAALADDHTLVAVVDATHLAALDLVRGVAVTRAVATGAVLLGPPSVRAGSAYVLAFTATAVFALAFDASGRETLRAIVSTLPASPFADAGATPQAVPAHVGAIVDPAGTLAFATFDGLIGVVTSAASVDTLGEAVCGRSGASGVAPWGAGMSAPSTARPGWGFAGLAPAGAGAFLAACEGGAVVRIAALEGVSSMR